MVTARIDLQGLNEELTSFKNRFDSWAHQSVANAEAQKEKHLRHLRELQTTIRNLQQQQIDLQKKSLEVQKRLHDEKEQIIDLESELSKITAEQNTLPALIAEVQAVLHAETRSAQSDAAEFADEEHKHRKTLQAVENTLHMYSSRLGLVFDHQIATKQFDLIFTQVDADRPDRPFQLSIQLVDDDLYTVKSCNPMLNMDDVQGLVDDLNANAIDFSNFVCGIRLRFQQTVQNGH